MHSVEITECITKFDCDKHSVNCDKRPNICDKDPELITRLPAAVSTKPTPGKSKVRVLFELCCEDDSSLHQNNPYKDTCEVVRITKRDDLLAPRTIKFIKDRMIQEDVCLPVVFISLQGWV